MAEKTGPTLLFGSVKKPLLILDLANNHNGSVAHGKAIIDSAARALESFDFRVSIKFQYRDLGTLIHPGYKGNHDFKYIKRFEETSLAEDELFELVDYCRSAGFLVSCTPFDEHSVQKVVDHGFDILKIASASATDWPLLDEVAKHNLPVIVSTGSLSVRETDRVAAFMRKRVDNFAMMHCVSVYPTPDDQLALNRIDFMRRRYRGVPVGYSTHEDPKNTLAGPLALAKGAHILERHIGLEANGITINAYSAQEGELRRWAKHLNEAIAMMSGMDDLDWVNGAELESVRSLRRGVYARSDLSKSTKINREDIFFAIPVLENQITANMWSKLEKMTTTSRIKGSDKLTTNNVIISSHDELTRQLIERCKIHFESAGVELPALSSIELSHHYGVDRFEDFGAVMATVINREYCKKIIGVLPGQSHPEHLHQKKAETFICISGTLFVELEGTSHKLSPGDTLSVEIGEKHAFHSPDGAVFEEISSTHFPDDSWYTDEAINANVHRKTKISIWSSNG